LFIIEMTGAFYHEYELVIQLINPI